MVDMAKSPADVTKELKQFPMGVSTSSDGPQVRVYPYGLCISFTQDELEKLNIEGGCAVGDMIHLCAIARVTACSESEMENAAGEKKRNCRIELQITHLATENEDEEEAREQSTSERRSRFYGSVDGDGAKQAA
jgi:hypothetical protein